MFVATDISLGASCGYGIFEHNQTSYFSTISISLVTLIVQVKRIQIHSSSRMNERSSTVKQYVLLTPRRNAQFST